jgi:Fe-S cluster assembly protein SufD
MKPNELQNNQNIIDNEAFLKLQEIGLPSKKVENYRHFDISSLLDEEYDIDLTDNFKNFVKDEKFITIILKNGIVDTTSSELSNDVQCSSKNKNLIETTNSLYYLSEAFLKDEQTLLINKNLDKPIMIVNQLSGSKSFIANQLNIKVQNDLHVDIVEVFDDESLRDSFVNLNRTFDISNNSELNYAKLQNLNKSNSMTCNFIPKIATSATCNVNMIDLGSKISLNVSDITLNNQKSSFSFHGIIRINESQKSGNIASMHHVAEETSSNFISKHILSDESSALFEVQSTVEQNAKFSKTFQNSQTILLDNGPKINAIPQLILHTDELEAAHGATSGSLDTEALYYLMSRGIDEKMASDMLIQAVELQILDTIVNSDVKEFALDFLKGK